MEETSVMGQCVWAGEGHCPELEGQIAVEGEVDTGRKPDVRYA